MASKPRSPASSKRRSTRSRKPQSEQDKSRSVQIPERPKTSPSLFSDTETTCMASALPLLGAGSILTQRKHLAWGPDSDGKLQYARSVENGKGAIYFWVTDDLEQEAPATLAGEAALAVIEAFDIRAACMHLILSAYITQLERPWEQEIILDDRQIEEYLGLRKRTDKNRQAKLQLIEEIVKQPCMITTYVSWPTQGKRKGFQVEEGRLWHLLGIRHHYQYDLLGNRELTGLTFTLRAGLWAKYFMTEEGRINRGICHYTTLSKPLLEDVMGVWQNREGAARLMVWLIFHHSTEREHPYLVRTLVEVAYGPHRIQEAFTDRHVRKKLVSNWDEDLLVLHERGWDLQFDPDNYPPELRPLSFGRSSPSRPRGFFEDLLSASLWISPRHQPEPELPVTELLTPEDLPPEPPASLFPPVLTGDQLRTLRKQRGWKQEDLAEKAGVTQSLISRLEKNTRTVSPDLNTTLLTLFEIEPHMTALL